MSSFPKEEDPFGEDDEILEFADDEPHGGQLHYHDDIFMEQEEDGGRDYGGIYGDEGMPPEYDNDDEEPYLHNAHYPPDVNPDFIDAHYINTSPEFLEQQERTQMPIDEFENPNFIYQTSTARRLQEYPEGRHLPAVRRFWRRPEDVDNDDNDFSPYMPMCGRSLDPNASEENRMLTQNKIYPKLGEIFVKTVRDPLRVRKPKSQSRPAPSAHLIRYHSTVPTRRRPQPIWSPEPEGANPESMTPLPNRYFQKRVTVSAAQIGFKSDNAKCVICGFIFRLTAFLASHMKQHEEQLYPIIKNSIGLLCPVSKCRFRCDTMATTVEHMKQDHQIQDLSFERIVFKDMEEFKLWRMELERLTLSKYSRTSGKKNAYSKSTYYQCQHSGSGASRHRAFGQDTPRTRISKKLARACTAFFHIRENEEDGTVTLRGCTKHSGHGRDVRFLPITDDIKMEIAQMLVDGLDEEEIIEKMRLESDVADRRFYLQPYEIRNVVIKIEKFKEDLKRKMDAGEQLPDLVSEPRPSRRYPVIKAELACDRYPINYDPQMHHTVDADFDRLVEQQVVQEEGDFVVPDQEYDYYEEEEEEGEYEDVVVGGEEEEMEEGGDDDSFAVEKAEPFGRSPKKEESVDIPVGRNTERKQAAKRRKIDGTGFPYEEEEEEDSDYDEQGPSTSTASSSTYQKARE